VVEIKIKIKGSKLILKFKKENGIVGRVARMEEM
jgi:hypothetical protein